jgi:hypothetical protein
VRSPPSPPRWDVPSNSWWTCRLSSFFCPHTVDLELLALDCGGNTANTSCIYSDSSTCQLSYLYGKPLQYKKNSRYIMDLALVGRMGRTGWKDMSLQVAGEMKRSTSCSQTHAAKCGFAASNRRFMTSKNCRASSHRIDSKKRQLLHFTLT